MDISAFKRDAKVVSGGKWIGDLPGMEDARLRVRGLTSPEVVALRSRKERAISNKGRNRDRSLKPEVALRVFGEVLHEAVLLEWDGLKDGKTPVPYDPELAKEWCTNPDFSPFADAVAYAAQIVDGGMEDVADATVGNSKRSSAGSSSTASDTEA